MEERNNDIIVLNRPRQGRRALTIATNGRITLRAKVCRLLELGEGDKIAFIDAYSQPCIIKANDMGDGIRLYGRKSQLHGCSVSTVRTLLHYIKGHPKDAKEIDLNVGYVTDTVRIGTGYYQALVVVTRTDPSHCR